MNRSRPPFRLRGPMLGSLATHAAVALVVAGAIGWHPRSGEASGTTVIEVARPLAAPAEPRPNPRLDPLEAPPVEPPRVWEVAETVPELLVTPTAWSVPLPDLAFCSAPPPAPAATPPAAVAELSPAAPDTAPAAAPALERVPTLLPPRVDPVGCPAPLYPRLARQHELEGVALLLLRVGADGRVLQAELLESSGHDILDQAALSGARAWRLTPASADGVAVAGALRVPLRFRLER